MLSKVSPGFRLFILAVLWFIWFGFICPAMVSSATNVLPVLALLLSFGGGWLTWRWLNL